MYTHTCIDKTILEPKKSLFAQLRQQKHNSDKDEEPEFNKIIREDIHKTVGNKSGDISLSDVVMRDVVEYEVTCPKQYVECEIKEAAAFPKIKKLTLRSDPNRYSKTKSIFAQAMEMKLTDKVETMDCDDLEISRRNLTLNNFYGKESIIVEDTKTAQEVHKENLTVLSNLKEAEILAERKNLLESLGELLHTETFFLNVIKPHMKS